MKKTPLVMLGFALAALGCLPAAHAQYRGARSYTQRIAPQLPPAPQRPRPPAQPVTPPAAPATPIRPITPLPAQPAAAVAPADPEKQRAEKEATTRRVVEFQKARAEAGSESAQCELGVRYLKGDGVDQDFELAHKWLAAAAKQGNGNAVKRLAELKQLEEGHAPAADAGAQPAEKPASKPAAKPASSGDKTPAPK